MKKFYMLLLVSFITSIFSQVSSNTPNPLETSSAFDIQPTSCSGIPTPGDLVINGNFEQNSAFPDNLSQIYLACEWSSPSIATPDYFHRNGDVLVDIPTNFVGTREVNPLYGGDTYSGIVFHPTTAVEIIRTELTQPLDSNTEYTLSFDVAATDYGLGGYLKFQAYLGSYIQINNAGDLPINSNGILLENSTFSNNTSEWERITFTFTTGPSANQEYLYIGAISNPQMTAYGYSYIDNISLIPTSQVSCGTCSDKASNFPVESNIYPVSNNLITKAVTSDCNGNIYSIGDENGILILKKYMKVK